MKILYVTTVGSMMRFFTSFIEDLLNDGHIVEIATNEEQTKVPDCYKEWGVKIHQIETSRSPINAGNLRAIKQIRKIVVENKYDIVHCHTPIAAMCTRIACRKARKKGTKVIYTAHGFHFYKGAPFKSWLLYYPVEKICSYFTDVLITINQEDYALAQKRMKAKKIIYIPGVGIDLSKFNQSSVDKFEKRKELGVPEQATMMLSIGELNENKNHEIVLRAIADIKDVYYLIAGEGNLHSKLQNVIEELNISNRVKMLGYRKDIRELCASADIYCMPSFREGLSVALMEAMSMGLPCIVSKIRGNTDLIDENGGVLFNPYNIDDFRRQFEKLVQMDLIKIGNYNKEKIKNFSIEEINCQMKNIYEEEMNGK